MGYPLDNLKEDAGRLKRFSSDNQPVTKGRKKVGEIKKLMKSFGATLAPQDLLEDETVAHFLNENGLKGTVNEVLIARLYTLALYKGDLKAMKLILDTLNNKNGGSKYGVVINLVAPPPPEQTEDLTNDSWTIQVPGESAPKE